MQDLVWKPQPPAAIPPGFFSPRIPVSIPGPRGRYPPRRRPLPSVALHGARQEPGVRLRHLVRSGEDLWVQEREAPQGRAALPVPASLLQLWAPRPRPMPAFSSEKATCHISGSRVPPGTGDRPPKPAPGHSPPRFTLWEDIKGLFAQNRFPPMHWVKLSKLLGNVAKMFYS